MNDKPFSTEQSDQPDVYTICLKGQLDARWSDWFDGFALILDEKGNTLLKGPIKDQAELHGVFRKVYNLGLTLLSVNME